MSRALKRTFAATMLPFQAVLGIAVLIAQPARGAEPDPNFEVSLIAEGFFAPTGLHQAPDGRLFIIERGGAIYTFNLATAQRAFWAQIDVITDGECGLLGLTLHPEFPAQPYVYVFGTVSSTEQQIIRLRDQAGVGIEPTVIRDGIPTVGFVHNGGCLRVGPDGMLYFSVGDNGDGANSQSMATLAGKVCRIQLDGGIPADNPLTSPTGARRAIYAMGLRNPFRFCFAPDGRLFVMDVGSSDDLRREEINQVTAGDNLGWPHFEGASPPAADAGYVNPIYDYHDKGSSIAGCVVYAGGQFPRAFRGNLLHLDFTSHALYRGIIEGDRVVSHTLLIQAEGGPVDLTTLLDGTLAYCEWYGGRVMRVRYIGPPDPPDSQPEPPASAPADEQVLGDAPGDGPETPDDAPEAFEAPLVPGLPCGPGVLTLLAPVVVLWMAIRRA